MQKRRKLETLALIILEPLFIFRFIRLILRARRRERETTMGKRHLLTTHVNALRADDIVLKEPTISRAHLTVRVHALHYMGDLALIFPASAFAYLNQ